MTIYFNRVKYKIDLPCCAKWQSASSMWRLIIDASLLAFCTIHGSAPSSISKDRLCLFPKTNKIRTFSTTPRFQQLETNVDCIHMSKWIIHSFLIWTLLQVQTAPSLYAQNEIIANKVVLTYSPYTNFLLEMSNKNCNLSFYRNIPC